MPLPSIIPPDIGAPSTSPAVPPAAMPSSPAPPAPAPPPRSVRLWISFSGASRRESADAFIFTVCFRSSRSSQTSSWALQIVIDSGGTCCHGAVSNAGIVPSGIAVTPVCVSWSYGRISSRRPSISPG